MRHGNPIERGWNPVERPGNPVECRRNSVERRGNPVERRGNSVERCGNPVERCGNLVVPREFRRVNGNLVEREQESRRATRECRRTSRESRLNVTGITSRHDVSEALAPCDPEILALG